MENIYYAHRGEDFWTDIHPNLEQLKFLSNDVCYEVKVRETLPKEESIYWGWKDSEDQNYSMIYPSKKLTTMCSPYNFE